MWETVETKARKIRIAKTKRERSKGGSRKKERGKREGKEEETKKGENGGGKESVIRRECGQTLARVRDSWIYISIIIISLQRMEST